MCMASAPSGGDGGAAERQRQKEARINSTVNAIRGVFSDPANEERFNEIRDSSFNFLDKDRERQLTEAQRKAKFALSRTGGIGGSQQNDVNSEIQRLNDEAIINIGLQADQQEQLAREADKASEQNLIGRANQGENQANLVADANNSLQTNLNQARINSQNLQLGDLFAGAGNLFANIDRTAGLREGDDRFRGIVNQQGNLGTFFNNPGRSGRLIKF